MKAEDVPDAVVRAEPKSPYGNPVSYIIDNRRYHPLDNAKGFIESGIASWYGSKFHGRRTSSGEVFDAWKMTAAHKTLPLPSYVSVQDIETGKKIVVRVNDRGPFHPDRIIDLSYVAAAKLGIAEKGTGLVEIRVLEPKDPPPSNRSPDKPSTTTNVAKAGARISAKAPASVAASVPISAPASPSSSSAIQKESLPLQSSSSSSASASSPPSPPPSNPPASLPSKPMASAEVSAVKPASAEANTGSSLKKAIRGVFLQLASFRRQANAARLRDRLVGMSVESVQMKEVRHRGQRYYRVRVGPLPSRQSANEVADSLKSLGLGAPLIVSE